VKIGTQTWMAENLNYATAGSKCGNGSILSDVNTSTCDTYGRLYNWAAAKTACPSGWHLPNDAEWGALMQSVNPSCSLTGDCANAGRLLKATSGWNSNGNGSDVYGFAALPGGEGHHSDGKFYSAGNIGGWWSATESNNADYAFNRSMLCNYEGVGRGYYNKLNVFSVRCLQD
jgi:uncharacterized protein (TIGR02145 family)